MSYRKCFASSVVAVVSILTLAVAFLYGGGDKASAHHLGYVWPRSWIPESYYTQSLEMRDSGVWRWWYEQQCGSANSNIYLAVRDSMVDFTGRYQVGNQEVSKGTINSQGQMAMCGSIFVASCGAEAAACVGSDSPGYPRNCDAKYSAAVIAAYFSLESRKSVVKHEKFHCSSQRAEDYDDDRTDGTNYLRCIVSLSIMGCGPNHPNDFSELDDEVWKQVHFPPVLDRCIYTQTKPCVGMFGTTVYWERVTDTRGRVLSFAYDDVEDGYGNGYWVYSMTKKAGDVYSPYNSSGIVEVEYRSGRCVYVLEGNFVSYPMSEWWQLAGCFQ